VLCLNWQHRLVRRLCMCMYYIYIYTSSSRRCPLISSVNLSNVANLSDEKVPYSISRCQKSPTNAGLFKEPCQSRALLYLRRCSRNRFVTACIGDWVLCDWREEAVRVRLNTQALGLKCSVLATGRFFYFLLYVTLFLIFVFYIASLARTYPVVCART